MFAECPSEPIRLLVMVEESGEVWVLRKDPLLIFSDEFAFDLGPRHRALVSGNSGDEFFLLEFA